MGRAGREGRILRTRDRRPHRLPGCDGHGRARRRRGRHEHHQVDQQRSHRTGVAPALLAKEAAGIDAVSGGRLTLGLGIGGRADDFVVEGLGPEGRGKRLDHDLAIYRDIWRGEPIGGTNPAVPAGTREVPLLFGGFAPPAFQRMARWGQGYIGASMPAAEIADAFDKARAAWNDAGREGSPRLVAIAYYALEDIDKGRANVRDYYSVSGDEIADATASRVHGGPDAVKATVREFAEIGADELIFTRHLMMSTR